MAMHMVIVYIIRHFLCYNFFFTYANMQMRQYSLNIRYLRTQDKASKISICIKNMWFIFAYNERREVIVEKIQKSDVWNLEVSRRNQHCIGSIPSLTQILCARCIDHFQGCLHGMPSAIRVANVLIWAGIELSKNVSVERRQPDLTPSQWLAHQSLLCRQEYITGGGRWTHPATAYSMPYCIYQPFTT